MMIFAKNSRITNVLVRFNVLLALAISVSACGFHLRGNIPLPEGIQNMYVQVPEGPFKDQLLERLENAGGQLAAAPSGADVILDVTQAISDRTIGTLDTRGKVNSYNVRFRVSYNLLDTKGRSIRPTANLTETRRYDFDEQLVVESESEEAELRKDLEESIALRIVRKLSSVTDFQPGK